MLDKLDGTAWRVVAIDGAPPLVGTELTLRFDAGRAAGSAGANRYFTSWKLDGSKLTFGQAGATRMVLNEPPGIMEQEARFLPALTETDPARVEDTALVLGAAGKDRLRFEIVR